MGLFNKIKKALSKSSTSKDNQYRKKTIYVSNDRGYQAQAERNTRLSNELQDKKNELDNVLSKVNNYKQKEADIYEGQLGWQRPAQVNVRNHFVRLVNQRARLAKSLEKLNEKWPDDQDKVLDMIIESEKEVSTSEEVKKTWDFISSGKDPSSGDFRSRYFDMGEDPYQTQYDKFFDDPIIERVEAFAARKKP